LDWQVSKERKCISKVSSRLRYDGEVIHEIVDATNFIAVLSDISLGQLHLALF
jgi:hypothetical protein